MAAILFPEAVSFLEAHGYTFMFLAFIVEGPILTAAAGFAAALGSFSLAIIILLSFLGSQLPDMFFFFLGKHLGLRAVEKYGRRFGISKKHLTGIKSHTRNHGDKALAIVKLTPFIASFGIMVLAVGKYSTRRFLIVSTLMNAVSAIVFAGLGFSLGFAFSSATRYIDITIGAIVFLLILLIVVPLFYRKVTLYITKRLEKT